MSCAYSWYVRRRCRAGRVLQLGDRVRRPHVVLAAHAERVLATGVEGIAASTGSSPKAEPMQAQRLLGDLEHADALDVAGACR
jgi:hypothetical protein